MKRILLAALLGGVAMYIWTTLAHTVLPIGSMGMSSLPNEDAVLSSLSENVPSPGMYYFPGIDMSGEVSDEQMAAFTKKHENGPAGLMIYTPKGGEVMPPSMLVIEFVGNLFGALALAFVAASLTGSYGRRVLLLSLFGFFAWVSISVGYWTWYRFPTAFTVSEGIDIIVGVVVAGLVIAKMVPAAERRIDG